MVRHKQSGQLYVVKQIALDPSDSRMAMNELKMMEVCNQSRTHPNICQLRGSFEENGALNIVMDYYSQGDLTKWLDTQQQQNTSLSEERILLIFIQIALALKYLNGNRKMKRESIDTRSVMDCCCFVVARADRHILHRDLKPQNIFISKDFVLKVGDFGIARAMTSTHALATTPIGTPYFLSPEICEGHGYNQKCDVYACGCIIYQLCTHRHPFTGRNLKELVENILGKRIALAGESKAAVSAAGGSQPSGETKSEYDPLPSSYSRKLHLLVRCLLQRKPEVSASEELSGDNLLM